MKINKWLYMSAALLVLAGCDDDWNEDKLDGFKRPEVTDIKKIEYTLLDADYKAIATNKTNKALAESLGLSDALSKLTNDKYFTDEIPASKFIPAFLSDTYPTADDKSAIKVTYSKLVGEPEYLATIGGAKHYQLTSDDYAKVWGESVKAPFLSPKTENRISKLLGEAMEDAAEGDMVMVDYAYSETEPSIGGGEEKMVYQQVSEITEEGGNYVIVAPDKEGNLIPFGKLQDESKNYGHMAGEAVTVTNGFITSDVTDYVIAVAPSSVGYTLQRPDGKFIYQQGTYNSFNLGATIPDNAFADWVFQPIQDGMFTLVNDKNKKTVKLNFYEKGGTYSYGCYPGTSFGEYLNASMKVNDGDFKAQNIALEEVSYVWKYDAGYGYWKAGAYANNKNNPTESWLVSPEIDLSKATKPVLSFDNILNHLKGHERAGYVEAYILADYTDDVQTAAKTLVEGITWGSGSSWTAVNSGDIDLSAYAGKKVRLAFMYKSTTECAPTFEVYNIAVKEPVNGYYADVKIFKQIPESEAAMSVSAYGMASTRSADGCNRTALYAYDGSGWNKHALNGITLDVMQPEAYSSLGVGYLTSASTVLPVYLKNAYPYAQEEDVIAVAYYASAENAVAAKELIYNGAEWIMTQKAISFVDKFVKSNGAWVYDPSVVLELPVGKNQPVSSVYYQAMTDWVWENVDVPNGMVKGQGYVTTYGNNEYYTGASAYQGNADWRPSAAKNQYPAEYESMADADIVALLQKRFVEVMGEVLASLNPDAKMVDGVDVFYTINFGVYTGTAENWTVVYKLVADGKFEYVEGSLAKR